MPGRHSSISASIAAKRTAFASLAIVVSGRATPVIELPTATPMRRVPKSNASTVRVSVAVALATRQACPTSSDRREKSMPRRRIAAGSRASTGVSNSTPGSAATVSQAFCAISCSSCPADQPA